MVNGIDELAVTKMDVLDTLPKIKVCVAYKLDGKVTDSVPADTDALLRCVPVYQEFDGWMTSTKEVREFDQLPRRARTYLQKLAQLTGARLSIVSVGAKRAETIFL